MLGLPDHVQACLFDLDGVLTPTALVHAAAWKETFDAFLAEWSSRTGKPMAPFDQQADYNAYVDGRPRFDGVRTFLAARGISLPDGTPDDPPDAATVTGLGNRKNSELLRLLRAQPLQPYPGSVAYLEQARAGGLRRAVVSASANCREVLNAAGLIGYIEVIVDGVVAAEGHLRGKPYPDTFVEAAHRLGLDAPAAAVFEDAVAGVEAGKAGGFGFVVGVDRVGHREDLQAHGASIVVSDLSELLP